MQAYISLGSNLGDRKKHIKEAIANLGTCVKKVSPIIETEPVGMSDKGGKFLNAVAEIETELPPYELLDLLEEIEKKLGRANKGDYKSRTIDLDILRYGDLKIDTVRLKIPHPKLKERDFLCRLLRELKQTTEATEDF